jgi:hypothetical protein
VVFVQPAQFAVPSLGPEVLCKISSLVRIFNPEILMTLVRAAAPRTQGDASASLDPIFRGSYTPPGSKAICELLLNARNSGSQWKAVIMYYFVLKDQVCL